MISFQQIGSLVGRSNATILEVGANDGEETLKFLETFQFGTVAAFEPDPRAQERFLSRVKNDRAALVKSAVGAVDGTCTFNQSSGTSPSVSPDRLSDWDLSGSIKRPLKHLQYHPWVKFERTLEVDITRLDTWTAKNKVVNVDFIWADVQGAEQDLIAGAEQTLARTRWFYTEYANVEMYQGQLSLKEIVRRLPNFEVVEVFENDVLLRNKSPF